MTSGDIADSPRSNADLAPVPAEARTWGAYDIAALWAGMSVCIPTYMLAAGLVASASVLVFGEAIWDPVALTARFDNPIVILLAVFALAVATLTTNIAANVVPPANAFANLWPRRISFVAGGLITGVIGIAIMPWKLLSDFQAYIFGWLVGYSGLLGPVAGILIADYWVLRRTRLNLRDLYVDGGEYPSINWAGMIALAAGIAAALIGVVVPPLHRLYDYAWFVGFGTSAVLYLILARSRAVQLP